MNARCVYVAINAVFCDASCASTIELNAFDAAGQLSADFYVATVEPCHQVPHPRAIMARAGPAELNRVRGVTTL